MKSKLLCFSTLLLLTACNNSSDSPPAADTPGGTFDLPAETAPALAAVPDPDRDMPLEDKTFYGLKGGDSVELSQVSEATSLMHHTMKIGGKDVKFTARAGHLIAYKPMADGAQDPQAAIFYTSYTRDDLPSENRPVTFFWNGGPGSSSKFLHLGSWAPKRMVINPPGIPPEYFEKDQPTFPVIDDAETLLDQSDLVFVDPAGTGFSSAIAPHRNDEFWNIDADPKVLRDFITRYINTYNRQSSPKYLYGESYGGIRTPITARLLLEAGTAHYLPDPSGKPPLVLSGIVLQSPVLDYNSSCGLGSDVSCEGLLPTFAATADYLGLSSGRAYRPLDDYLAEVRTFGATAYRSVQRDIISKIAHPSEKTPQQEFVEKLAELDLRDEFMHRSDAGKAELLKVMDALAPTPLRAFVAAAVASAQSRFTMTKFCVEWSKAQRAAAASPSKTPVQPELPVAIDVDLSAYKRAPLSAKDAISVEREVKYLHTSNETFPFTEKMITSGYLFDRLNREASAAVKYWAAASSANCPRINAWSDFVLSDRGIQYLQDLHRYTGVGSPQGDMDSPWVRYPNMDFDTFLNQLLPRYSFNVYDARTAVPGMNYDPSFADSAGGNAAMDGLLPGFIGYINKSAPYMGLNDHINVSWDWTPDPGVKFSTSRLRTSIPDLIESLTLKSDLKVLVLHGYTDMVTPFHQTELDLENAKLADRIPVKNFEGGHMTYSNEASRVPMKAALDQFYAGALGGPGTGFGQNLPVAAPAAGSAVPANSPAEVAAFLEDMDRQLATLADAIDVKGKEFARKAEGDLYPSVEAAQAEYDQIGKLMKEETELEQLSARYKRDPSLLTDMNPLQFAELKRKYGKVTQEAKQASAPAPVTAIASNPAFRDQSIQQRDMVLAELGEIQGLVDDVLKTMGDNPLGITMKEAFANAARDKWNKIELNQDNTEAFKKDKNALAKYKQDLIEMKKPSARASSAGIATTDQEKAALLAEAQELVNKFDRLPLEVKRDNRKASSEAGALRMCIERCARDKLLDRRSTFDEYKARAATVRQFLDTVKVPSTPASQQPPSASPAPVPSAPPVAAPQAPSAPAVTAPAKALPMEASLAPVPSNPPVSAPVAQPPAQAPSPAAVDLPPAPSAQALPGLRDRNIEQRDVLLAEVKEVEDMIAKANMKPDLTPARKAILEKFPAAVGQRKDQLNRIDLEKDNTADLMKIKSGLENLKANMQGLFPPEAPPPATQAALPAGAPPSAAALNPSGTFN